jgi:putative Mn2+ efflux pump MntP
MIYESISEKQKKDTAQTDPSRGWNLVLLSFATSIDALAVGLSLGVIGNAILVPSIIIGLVCAAFSLLGIFIGRKTGTIVGRRAEIIGGLLLVAIGAKIVLEHAGVVF